MTRWKRILKNPAFTLLELLVVIGIMAILMALMVPATGSIMRSINMNRAVSLVVDELNFARQTALSKNQEVEIRFYKLGSTLDPADKQFRAMRCYLAAGKKPEDFTSLGRLKRLPESIVISSVPRYSSLMDFSAGNELGLKAGTEKLSGTSETSEYVSFRFRANGSTSLAEMGKWFLTLYPEAPNVGMDSELPANLFTAQLDPVTGRVRSFRP